jgi:hypothetical protein
MAPVGQKNESCMTAVCEYMAARESLSARGGEATVTCADPTK